MEIEIFRQIENHWKWSKLMQNIVFLEEFTNVFLEEFTSLFQFYIRGFRDAIVIVHKFFPYLTWIGLKTAVETWWTTKKKILTISIFIFNRKDSTNLNKSIS